jgi:putative ABC transport system permease protein
MIKHYFKISLRNLEMNKTMSFINIAGLAAGMAIALLISLWVWNELSFDHYHRRYRSIAQAIDVQMFNGEASASEAIAIPLANALRTQYSGKFKHVVLAFPNYTHSLAFGDIKVSASGTWVDPLLPDVFTFEMISGDRNTLSDPSSALINQSLATALFGNQDPIGKNITLDNSAILKIGGVFKDFPENTTFHGTSIFLPWDKALTVLPWLKDNLTRWDSKFWKLFVEMNDRIDIEKTSAEIKDIAKPFIKEGNEQILLHPMSKWHLYNEFLNGRQSAGRLRLVWLFAIIGVFVLLLACINFMNLSTARSGTRAKEVGIRKAIGSTRGQLIGQFMGEALLVSFAGFILALALAQLSLPSFNEIAHKEISIPYGSPVFWGLTLLSLIFTGVLAGCYPSFFLSAFPAVKVLKGSFKAGRYASLPRKILITVQFTVSIVLIIGTIIVYRQIQYAKDRPSGYDRGGLITVSMNTPEIYGAPYNRLRSELLQTGVVADMAESAFNTTEAARSDNGYSWKGKDPQVVALITAVGGTHDYGKTIGWKIKEGRDFSREYPSDSTSIIINESMAKLTGMRQPAGEMIRFDGKDHLIIGVVHDMITQSPYAHAEPTIYYLTYTENNILFVKLRPTSSIHDAISRIEPVFRRFNPGIFEYHFVEDEYARKFDNEAQIGQLAFVFTLFALFISCLGLFGLASFTAEQRRKEIGIRKVLGASLLNLWALQLRGFVILVILSLLIASLVVYLLMNKWLRNYEYHTSISWWIFILAGIWTLAITVSTVSYQSIKAAMANPVKSLRAD